MGISFGGWPDSIHDDFEQVKRIESAKKIKPGEMSVDLDSKTIRVQGSASEPYVATLSECTCADFQYRKAPCKHIYRLALELDLLKPLPKYNKKNKDFNAEAEIARYQSLYLDGKISADAYVKICTTLSKL